MDGVCVAGSVSRASGIAASAPGASGEDEAFAVKVVAIPASRPERISSEAGRGTFEKRNKFLVQVRTVDGSKMAQNAETPFKVLQSWTILLVESLRSGKIRGSRALQASMHANNYKRD